MSGTTTFFMQMAAGKKRPYRRRLNYLESTGTQYIDTGLTDYVNDHRYRIVNTVAFTYGSSTHQTGANGVLQVTYQAGYFGISAGSMPYNISVGAVFTYEEYGGSSSTTTLVVDGVSQTRTWTSNFGGNLLLFALKASNNVINYAKMRCYELKVYSNANNSLVQDLIPVLDWSDVPCMYDQVSGSLFYNAGSGTFDYA